MWPFTAHIFCLLVLDARWFFFPSYLSWEVETWLHFTGEESEAESHVMEPVPKHRPISAFGAALVSSCSMTNYPHLEGLKQPELKLVFRVSLQQKSGNGVAGFSVQGLTGSEI